MKYIVVTGQNIQELSQRVDEYLAGGYELVGGVQFDKINLPYQSMIKQTADIPALLKPKAKTTKGETKNA